MTVGELADVLTALKDVGHGGDTMEIIDHDEYGNDTRCEVSSVTLIDGGVAVDWINIEKY